MDPSIVIDEEETYSTSEVASVFDVSRQSVINWENNGKLTARRDRDDNRKFHGQQIIKDINDSKLLRKRLREAQNLEVKDTTYASKLENRIFELEDRIEDLQADKKFLREQVEKKDDQIERLLVELDRVASSQGDTSTPAIEPSNDTDRIGDRVLEQARRLPVLGDII